MRRALAPRVAFPWIAYAFLVAMAGTTLPTPLYPIYQEQFGFGDLMVTVIFAVYGFAVIVGLLLTGRLSDEVGRRRVLIFGLACAALSAVMFIIAQGVGPMFVGRLLSGLSAGAFAGVATAFLLDLAPADKRSTAAGIAVAVNLGGLGVGTLLSGAIAEVADAPLRVPYWTHLGLLAPALLGVLLAPETVEVKKHPRFVPQSVAVPREVRRTFVPAALGGFTTFAISGLFGAVGPLVLAQLLGYHSHLLAGGIVFMLFMASAAGQLVVDRLGDHRSVIVGCLLAVAAAAVVAATVEAESLVLLICAGLLGGIGQGLAVGGGLAALSAETPPERRGQVSASFFVVAYIGLSVPIIGFGLVSEATGLRTAAVIFSGVVGALAAAGAASLIVRQREPAGASRSRARQP
jgi:MFS family permease